MSSVPLQEKLRELLTFTPKALRASGAQEGRDRLREAFLQLVSFQSGTLALAEGLTDRKLLFDHDIEKNCPAPCQKCDSHDSPSFGFRCLLKSGDRNRELDIASRHGMACGSPKPRFLRWLRRFPYQRQCTVADWKEAALQHTHVSAMLACATSSIFLGLASNMTAAKRAEIHRICVAKEQGNEVSPAEEEVVKAQAALADDMVPKGATLAFAVVTVLGFASGLAGLRVASSGNERPVLLEGASATLEPRAFSAVFTQLLAGEGLEERDADLAMYGSRDLVRREEVLQRIEAGGDDAERSAKETFKEGTKYLNLAISTMEVSPQYPTQRFTGHVLALAAGLFISASGAVAAISWITLVSDLAYGSGPRHVWLHALWGFFGIAIFWGILGVAVFLGFTVAGWIHYDDHRFAYRCAKHCKWCEDVGPDCGREWYCDPDGYGPDCGNARDCRTVCHCFQEHSNDIKCSGCGCR